MVVEVGVATSAASSSTDGMPCASFSELDGVSHAFPSCEEADGKPLLREGGALGSLAPIPPSNRPWGVCTFANAWLGMIMNPSSFSAGASLLSIGLTVPEAAVSHGLGGLFLLAALTLNAWAGVKYGIPFPVFSRASFGYHGAQFCTVSRGGVAIMWLSFQLWQGTLALVAGIGVATGTDFASWGRIDEDLSAVQLVVFLAFAALHMVAVWFGPRYLQPLINVVAPVLVAGALALIPWAATLAPFGPAMHGLNASALEVENMPKGLQWMAGLNSAVSTWSTLTLNVCDLSRFAPTQRVQIVGQSLGLPIPFALSGFMGAWIAGATYHATGTALWQVPQYFALMPRWAALLGALGLALAIVLVNVVANMLSPINDFLNLVPLFEHRAPRLARKCTFRACAAATLASAVCVCPWWTFSSASRFILLFLGGYGMLTGAIAGIMISDFWLLRRGTLDVEALYELPRRQKDDRGGIDPVRAGVERINWRAFVAVALAVAPLLPGFIHDLRRADNSTEPAGGIGGFWAGLYDMSVFAAFATAGGVYTACECAFKRPHLTSQTQTLAGLARRGTRGVRTE